MTQPSFSCTRCGYTTFALFDIESGRCPFCSHESTRAEVETDWFGAPITRDNAPTFRVARFVQALRRLRAR